METCSDSPKESEHASTAWCHAVLSGKICGIEREYVDSISNRGKLNSMVIFYL